MWVFQKIRKFVSIYKLTLADICYTIGSYKQVNNIYRKDKKMKGQKDYSTEDVKRHAIGLLEQAIEYLKFQGEKYIPKPDTNMYDAVSVIQQVFSHFWPTPVIPKDAKIVVPMQLLEMILSEMEILREKKQQPAHASSQGFEVYEKPDYIIRLCEAIVAEKAGYKDRNEWKHLQKVG